MALLNSENLALGASATPFNLVNALDGKKYSLENFKDKKILVLLFICVHCPYVQAIEDRLIQLRKDYEKESVQLVGICSNDFEEYPEDHPFRLKKRAEEKNYGFPYLVDESQEVAKAYQAVCTPDIYVYDQNRKLAYHGRLDDSWKDPDKVTRHEIREAIDALLADQNPDSTQMPSMGCSIKWKK